MYLFSYGIYVRVKKHNFKVVHENRHWEIHWRRKIAKYYGKHVILKLPHIHALTGCDSSSYLHGVGKNKVFEKCVNSKEKMNLSQDVGVPSSINEKTFGKVSKFIQTMCDTGMEDESVKEKRVRIYKQLKTKTSQSKTYRWTVYVAST